MNTKQQLTDYVLERYAPVAIVLHGSRAIGLAKEHSDWDMLIFTNKKVDARREIQFGQNIDIAQVVLPIADNKIESTFGFYFRKENTEILYDPTNIAVELMAKNEEILKAGNVFTDDDRIARYAFMQSALNGVRDYIGEPLIVFSKKSEFYEKGISAWFRFLHSAFRPSNYIGFPYIQKEDPAFFAMLQEFIADNSQNSIAAGERILGHIFPDLKQKYDEQ